MFTLILVKFRFQINQVNIVFVLPDEGNYSVLS